jgi:hypothetical protein
MTDPVFEQGFNEAKKRILDRLRTVVLETYPDRNAFDYTAPVPTPRRPSDVLDDCIRCVSGLKCPDTKG